MQLDFESAPFSHLGTSPDTRTLYQRDSKKSRFFPGLFCHFQNRIHRFTDIFIVFPAMGTQACRTVLAPLLRIPEITAAAVSQTVQRAVAENTAEGIRIRTCMAGKVLTLFMLKEVIIRHNHPSKYFSFAISHVIIRSMDTAGEVPGKTPPSCP